MRRCLAGDFHRQGIVHGRFHLRSHKTLPDQLVELEERRLEVGLDLLGIAQHGCGADGLMGFLGAHGPGLVYGRLGRQEIAAVFSGHIFTRFVTGERRDVGRVGTHIGDQTGRAAIRPHR